MKWLAAASRFAVVTVVHDDPFLNSFVAYYQAQGASKILIIDHDSTDGAVAQVAKTWPDLVSVETIPLRPEVAGMDDDWRRLAFQALRERCIGQTNFVVMADCDEFICSKTCGETIRDALSRYPTETVLGTVGYDVIQRPDDPPINFGAPLLTQRKRNWCHPAAEWYSKPILMKANGDERLTVGHHHLVGSTRRPTLAPFYLFHLAAIDQEVYLARRLMMCRRQSALNFGAWLRSALQPCGNTNFAAC